MYGLTDPHEPSFIPSFKTLILSLVYALYFNLSIYNEMEVRFYLNKFVLHAVKISIQVFSLFCEELSDDKLYIVHEDIMRNLIDLGKSHRLTMSDMCDTLI